MVHYAFPMVVIRKTNASLFDPKRSSFSLRLLHTFLARNAFVSNQLVSVCFGRFTVCHVNAL